MELGKTLQKRLRHDRSFVGTNNSNSIWSLMLGSRVPRQVGRRGELRRAGRAAVAGRIGGRGSRVPVRDHDMPVEN